VTTESHFGHLFPVVTLCVQLMHNLSAIAKFLVNYYYNYCCCWWFPFNQPTFC